jgi:hypothetical protein
MAKGAPVRPRTAREFESGADYSDAPREINSRRRRMTDHAGHSG